MWHSGVLQASRRWHRDQDLRLWRLLHQAHARDALPAIPLGQSLVAEQGRPRDAPQPSDPGRYSISRLWGPHADAEQQATAGPSSQEEVSSALVSQNCSPSAATTAPSWAPSPRSFTSAPTSTHPPTSLTPNPHAPAGPTKRPIVFPTMGKNWASAPRRTEAFEPPAAFRTSAASTRQHIRLYELLANSTGLQACACTCVCTFMLIP